MRVALLSIHTSPLAHAGSGQAGGMNVYVRRLAEGLSAQGVSVDMFTRRTDTHTPDVIEVDDRTRLVTLRGGPARAVPKSVLPLHVPSLVAGMRDFMQTESIEYDILHSHYWFSGLVATRVRLDYRTPVIHMFHTLSKAKEFHFGQPDPADSALRQDAERCIINGADCIVGATESELEYIERLYSRSPARFEIIPPGVDARHFRHRGRRQSRQQLGIEADKVILFVGRLDRIKGIDILLEAVAEIAPYSARRVQAVILGHDGGGRRHLNAYQQMAARLGIADYVEFRGVVSQEELPLYYSAADVLAAPSAYESFGMAVIESMACETPVVGFRVGGLAATVREGQTGFLAAPGDRRDYVAKLHTALWRADLPDMGRAARRDAVRYSWEAVTDHSLALYDDLVAERTLPTRASAT